MGRMSAVSGSSAGPAGSVAVNDYDSFAEAYTAETEANLVNGHYMRRGATVAIEHRPSASSRLHAAKRALAGSGR
jgi:hypothetical protein